MLNFSSVAVQWALRRVPEFAGIIVTLVTFYNSIPPQYQDIIMKVISGQGGGLTISAFIGFALWLYAQVVSFRATNKPQAVVEENGKLVSNTLSPAKETEVAKTVENVSSKKSLLDIILGK
jgi:hypothetical protein